MGKLDGKTALITGASKGIGEGIARTFVKHGARVVLAARGQGVEDMAAQLRAEGAQAVAVRMDVSDMDSVRAGYEAGVKEFGQIDILMSRWASRSSSLWVRKSPRRQMPALDTRISIWPNSFTPAS